jgi:transglutaminase-like putative cysteine protease
MSVGSQRDFATNSDMSIKVAGVPGRWVLGPSLGAGGVPGGPVQGPGTARRRKS